MQLLIDSIDIIVIVVYISKKKIVVILIYILDLCSWRTKKENLKKLSSRLKIIKELA